MRRGCDTVFSAARSTSGPTLYYSYLCIYLQQHQGAVSRLANDPEALEPCDCLLAATAGRNMNYSVQVCHVRSSTLSFTANFSLAASINPKLLIALF